MDALVVPTHTRPEMLWHCLEHLEKADGIGEVKVVICIDRHHNTSPKYAPEAEEVTKKFPQLNSEIILRPIHRFWGNSFNVLTAYKELHAAGCELIFEVEDDVMIEPDFFTWHRSVQAGKPFCSVASINTRSGKEASWEDFASLGVCFSRDSVGQIVRHATVEYFSDMVGYCRRKFQGDGHFWEQDGLILRVMKQAGGQAIFSPTPRARHIGWYGYNRGNMERPKGDLTARYLAVRERLGEHVL